MAGFAIEDMFLKAAARHMPVGEVITLFGLTGTIAFILLAIRQGDAPLPPAMLSRPMIIRSGFEITGRLFYSLAIALTPLSVASAILQATPLVVVAGAALLFGETVGLRRWLAILAGFAGVLLIIRPGLEGFDALSLLTVIGLIGFAGRDLATRAAPPALTNMQLGVAGFAMLTLAGIIILAVNGDYRMPDRVGLGLTLFATLFGVAAYTALTVAMRTGEVSAVTPFRYTRLLFALILGATIFGERPDAWTLIGSAIVVASGIYVLTQNRRA
ncbi:MAG: DMT family transporter [Rhodobacteraceae bacterium]|nr:DMT family transporter [Paracoccaceae bacterium]